MFEGMFQPLPELGKGIGEGIRGFKTAGWRFDLHPDPRPNVSWFRQGNLRKRNGWRALGCGNDQNGGREKPQMIQALNIGQLYSMN
jgi:hypothetical protein